MPTAVEPLPIDAVLPALKTALEKSACVVLQAPPGAGKTTRVPLALLDELWLAGGRIVMLEPRRLAARAAARFMARQIGDRLGGKIGYRIRMDARVSADTRIEVVTEGVLIRQLQADPTLAGVGLVILDEFHERSLDADLALALLRDVHDGLRPDLKLLVMSATLDGDALARFLGGAPVVESAGRAFPVETRYLDAPAGDDVAAAVAAAVRRALDEQDGSVLAFLPGEGEIRRAAARLPVSDLPPEVEVRPLYGALSADEQDRAIAPAPAGRRKVVLATSIAETSLTIEGVRVVVDGGYRRVPRFDPRSGMTRLRTVRVSRASATQRQGRAGRLAPGTCYRLWTAAQERGFAAFDEPEIRQADLAPLALALAEWGVGDAARLAWLDPPPAGAMAQSHDLLHGLEALDADGRITPRGRAMAALPLHPRLAHMVVRGGEAGYGALACDLAALMSERDIATDAGNVDLAHRLHLLRSGGRGRVAFVRELADRLRRQAGVGKAAIADGDPGLLVAFAYPDRIGQRHGADGQYRLSGGGSARLPEHDPLRACDFIAVAETDGKAQDARVFLAAAVAQADLEAAFAGDIVGEDLVVWDDRSEAVLARRRRRLGALILDDRPFDDADPDAVVAAVLDGVRRPGLAALPWTDALRQWQQRVLLLGRVSPGHGWPDVSDAALLATLADWLAPYLGGIRRRAQFDEIPLKSALAALLPWPLPARLDELAPERLPVPSGGQAAVRYAADAPPALRVPLQEVFGLTETPTIAGGRVAVSLELLSPARRPLAVTADLASFWRNAYPQVRAEMRGRYPKHDWPEDPLTAAPTRGPRRRRS